MEDGQMSQVLSPEEKEEFDLRISNLAENLRFRFEGFTFIPEQFRELYRASKKYELDMDPWYFGNDEALRAKQQEAAGMIYKLAAEILGKEKFAEGDRNRRMRLERLMSGQGHP
jgi:hypothetical protein